MGIVFGSTGAKEPSFVLLRSFGPTEVRSYPPYVIAEVTGGFGEGNTNNKFRILAKYIGVFGDPQNQRAEAMAMTSPVISAGERQKMAMTSPVVSDQTGDSMAFILPEEIKKVSQAPVPKDKRVVLREVPARTIASFRYTGWYNKDLAMRHANDLRNHLIELNLLADRADESNYEVAQYHPPFTLGPLRRNEVWISLNEANPEVKALLEQSKVNSG